ncbi:MAG: GMC oxidoreductase [Gemmatimonadetes bacterium]|nr:GMC oxidoreductase [Gemmatimonadota bacterium]
MAPLATHRVRSVEALAETILEAGTHVPPPDQLTAERALDILSQLPPHLVRLYRAGLLALDAAALLHFGRRFSRLSAERRKTLLASIARRPRTGGRLVTALTMPIKTAHIGRRDYLDSVGAPSWKKPAREPEPRYMAQVMRPDELDSRADIAADVVIVGTGAGGAPTAALLAERGLAVAMIEEGNFEQREKFSGPPERRVVDLWRDGGLNFTIGNTAMMVPAGKLVGGTTAINSGTCLRTPESVLQEWRGEHGFPEAFSPDRFGRYLDAVEKELDVAPADRRYLGAIAEIVGKGADALGKAHGPLPRNAPGCDGQGVCSIGCPTGAKRSTDISYVPRALRAGAHLFTGMAVTRLLRRGRRVVAVEARGRDAGGAPRVLRVRADAIVLACGTLLTPLLLRANGIRLPAIGRNLSLHPALGMFARIEGDARAWDAIPQGYGVHDFVDPRIRFEGFYAPPPLSAPAYPLQGADFTRWMDEQHRVVQYGFMVRDRNVGRVIRGPAGRPLIRYDMTPEVLDLFRRGAAGLAELLLLGGAREVLTGVSPAIEVRDIDQARMIAELPLRPSDFTALAFHPLGTCRMGASPKNAVVDFDHRVFGTDNLYVADGSVVPTSLGVNPQVTIMAMAHRAAERLGARASLSSGEF